MGGYLLFSLSMMLCALLLGEARFGGRVQGKWSAMRRDKPLIHFGYREPARDDPPPPEEPGPEPPEANGKPAPLQPRPGHHLVAARALPPREDVYLLPKD